MDKANDLRWKRLETQENRIKRDLICDICKALGIILVISNHSGIPRVQGIISTFHMPLFFAISGILCAKSQKFSRHMSVVSFVFKKMKAFLVPYFIWGVIDLLVYAAVSPELFKGIRGLGKQICYYILGQRCYEEYFFTGALWFLTALFSCQIVFFLIVKAFKSSTAQYLVVFIFLVVSFSINDIVKTLPYNIDTIPFTLPYFALGYFGNKTGFYSRYTQKKSNIIQMIVAFVGVVMITTVNDRIDIFSCKYGNVFLYYCGGFLGILLVFEVAKLIIAMDCIRLNKALLFVGGYSLEYMAIHQQLIIHPLNSFAIKFGNNLTDFLVRFLLCFIVSTLLIGLVVIPIKERSKKNATE